jgi:hypothetical protein
LICSLSFETHDCPPVAKPKTRLGLLYEHVEGTGIDGHDDDPPR